MAGARAAPLFHWSLVFVFLVLPDKVEAGFGILVRLRAVCCEPSAKLPHQLRVRTHGHEARADHSLAAVKCYKARHTGLPQKGSL